MPLKYQIINKAIFANSNAMSHYDKVCQDNSQTLHFQKIPLKYCKMCKDHSQLCNEFIDLEDQASSFNINILQLAFS